MTDSRSNLLAGGLTESEGGGGIPVISGRARVVGYTVEEKVGDSGAYQRVCHKLQELDILKIKDGEEWPSENLEIFISYSNKADSLWGVWVKSIAKAAGIDLNEQDEDGVYIYGDYANLFSECIEGQVVEFSREYDHPTRRRNREGEWYDTTVKAWTIETVGEITSARGATASPEEVALGLAVGATDLISFMKAVGANTTVTGDKKLYNEIATKPNEWLDAQVAAGKFVAVGGWFKGA